jgi:hypothetical protein
MAKRVLKERTRNANTLTESEFFGKIRSGLRNTFRYWKPMTIALEKASRKYTGTNKRIKKEYQCASCGEWFIRKNVEIDHIVPCGSLRTYDDIVPFIINLTQEDYKSYQVLCSTKGDGNGCHKQKTLNERK